MVNNSFTSLPNFDVVIISLIIIRNYAYAIVFTMYTIVGFAPIVGGGKVSHLIFVTKKQFLILFEGICNTLLNNSLKPR